MASGFVIRRNQYYDSVFLMGVNKRLSEFMGVEQTAVLMGTDQNKRLLADIGVHHAEIDAAQASDLIAAVVAGTAQLVNEALARLDGALQGGVQAASTSNPHSIIQGITRAAGANLAVISVPGEFAAREARKALETGLHVFIFSSNVASGDELELKKFAAERGLLVMGPDCGTALIGGAGLGFANAIRRGPIGVIAAAGTGLQEFSCQVHNAGSGISHAIGIGSHDLSDEIGGLTAFSALTALEADPATKIIAIIAKPPGVKTLAKLYERLASCNKPVVSCILGEAQASVPLSPGQSRVRVIDEAVRLCIAGDGADLAPVAAAPATIPNVVHERARWSSEQQYVRGLFAGGTFCYQSQQLFRTAGIAVHSNVPLDAKWRLVDPNRSLANSLVDMGDDYFTVGRPHPMIDGTMRRQRILAEARDPQVAVLLLDFILGFNASMDPAGELLEAITEASRISEARGGHLTVVASICGTDGDPQDLALQSQLLREAGVLLFPSNAQAAGFCCELLKAR